MICLRKDTQSMVWVAPAPTPAMFVNHRGVNIPMGALSSF